jgi:hypothetical protein
MTCRVCNKSLTKAEQRSAFRGDLCTHCRRSVAYLENYLDENLELLLRAIAYLRKEETNKRFASSFFERSKGRTETKTP